MRHVKFLLDFDNARAKEYFNAKENTIHHSSSLPVDHKNVRSLRSGYLCFADMQFVQYMISERTLRLWEEQAQYDESWVDVPTAFIQSKDCTTSEDIAEEEEVEAMLGHLPSTRLSPALSPLHINFDKRDTRVRQSKPESASSTTPRKRRHTGDHHTSTDSPRMKKRVRFHPVDVEIVVPNYQPGRRASSTFPDENSPIRMRRPSRRVEPDFLNESSSCSRTPSPVPSSITSNMFANVLPSLPHGAHELLAFWSPLSSPSAYAAFARAFSPLAFLPTESISSNEEVPVLQQVGTGRGSSRARSVMPSLSSGSDSSSDDDLATPVDSRSSLHHIHSGSPGHEGLPHDGDELVLINEEAHNSADMTTLEAIHTTAGAAREPHRKIGWRPNKRKANPTDDWEVSLDDRPRQRHRGLPLRT
ncbi:hypothetical protein FA95DRAFT_1657392 [Auriscalpium vulgare]|uniref:Uncharacterized protein n=1 Tax=Auriscalpium vulgare TaxID=40419 RepID=A0ACB8RW07_9AGAM|nr:hypothetical protein FA95DRAFT_1657392 [Auriscalpium vulgare]